MSTNGVAERNGSAVVSEQAAPDHPESTWPESIPVESIRKLVERSKHHGGCIQDLLDPEVGPGTIGDELQNLRGFSALFLENAINRACAKESACMSPDDDEAVAWILKNLVRQLEVGLKRATETICDEIDKDARGIKGVQLRGRHPGVRLDGRCVEHGDAVVPSPRKRCTNTLPPLVSTSLSPGELGKWFGSCLNCCLLRGRPPPVSSRERRPSLLGRRRRLISLRERSKSPILCWRRFYQNGSAKGHPPMTADPRSYFLKCPSWQPCQSLLVAIAASTI